MAKYFLVQVLCSATLIIKSFKGTFRSLLFSDVVFLASLRTGTLFD